MIVTTGHCVTPNCVISNLSQLLLSLVLTASTHKKCSPKVLTHLGWYLIRSGHTLSETSVRCGPLLKPSKGIRCKIVSSNSCNCAIEFLWASKYFESDSFFLWLTDSESHTVDESLITLTSLVTSFMKDSSTAFIPYFLINLFSTTITSCILLKRDRYLGDRLPSTE